MSNILDAKITSKAYFECSRCKITTNTPNSMCPCPRGGCEANHIGSIVTTITTIKYENL